MKYSDLKSGYLLVFEDGGVGLFMKDTPNGDACVSNGDIGGRKRTSWCPMSETVYDESLRSTAAPHRNIKEVWSYSSNRNALILSNNERTLLWERKKSVYEFDDGLAGHEVAIDFENEQVTVGCTTIPLDEVKSFIAYFTATQKEYAKNNKKQRS